MNLDLLLEAEKRGILPPEKAPLLAEARKRGLIGGEAPAQPTEPTTGQRVKEFFLGDDDPNTQNMGEKIGTALNKAGESLTFGLIGDEASAAVESLAPGVDYEDRRDHYRKQEEVLERDNPGVALTADIGGAVAGAALPFGALGTLGRGAGALKRSAASAAAGGAGAGAYGFAEGEGGLDNRRSSAQSAGALGAGVGAAVPVAGAGVQKIADALSRRGATREIAKNAPTAAQQRSEASALYKQVDDANVSIRPDAVSRIMGDVSEGLKGEGAGFTGAEKVLPSSRAIMDASGDVGQGNTVPFQELDMFRRYVGNAAGANLANKSDTRAATQAYGKISDFVKNLTPDDVDAGDVEALTSALPKAQEMWAKMSKSQLVEDAIDNAENYVSGTASGLRSQFKRLTSNPSLSKNFTDDELRVLRRVSNGSIGEQALGYLGSGIGMMAQMGAGAATGGVGGAVAGTVAAMSSRKGAEALSKRNAEIARALIASGKAGQLPVASDGARKVSEALMRRGVAAVPQ